MPQAHYENLRDKRVLVAGAGITGIACAKALERKGAVVAIVDEKVSELEGFRVFEPVKVTISDFDSLLVSPGWREDHPLIVRAREAGLTIINEIDFAWSLKNQSQKWLALTGTNGKTSTVELAAEMLRQEFPPLQMTAVSAWMHLVETLEFILLAGPEAMEMMSQIRQRF